MSMSRFGLPLLFSTYAYDDVDDELKEYFNNIYQAYIYMNICMCVFMCLRCLWMASLPSASLLFSYLMLLFVLSLMCFHASLMCFYAGL